MHFASGNCFPAERSSWAVAAAVAMAEGCHDWVGRQELPLLWDRALRSHRGRQAAPSCVPSCIPGLYVGYQDVALLLFSFIFFLICTQVILKYYSY